MKKFTINFINRTTKEVVETHKTNNIEKCLKRIKRYDESGNMYMMYYESDLHVINNETGKEVKYYE